MERELERFRQENLALNDQIKLLVQTEQRLYRSQSRLDAQLQRQRSLAQFSIASTGVELPSAILGRALELLSAGFSLDWIGVVRLEPVQRAITLLQVHEGPEPDGQPIAIDPAGWEWLAARHEAQVVLRECPGPPGPAWEVVRAIAPETADCCRQPGAGRLACLPLRSVGDDRPGAILACLVRQSVAHSRQEGLDDEQLPFLQLLVNHVDHEIASVRLTASLSERSAELASSLATLETTQHELFQAQKLEAVGRLAGGVAHDFNNLLTVILGYAGTLNNSFRPGSPQQENVRRILEAGRRAAGITAQLLALGRRQVQRREPFDLSEQAERTADLLRRLVGEQIRLELDLSRGMPPVNADRAQVEQVMLNLMVNARDAMPEGGAMRIVSRPATLADAARCEGRVNPRLFAALDVEDSGVGMDEPTQQRIFEPFYTTKGAGKGSGLGLAVVYGIVKQSEGHVLVRSRPGQGSRFTVLLPFSLQESREEAPVEAARPAAGPAPARCLGTILVVEDEPVIREVVVVTLREAGHRVFEAGDGEEALQSLESLRPAPDLVLTDVVMPKIGGLRLAEELGRRHPEVRVAFMSGYSEELLGGNGRHEEPMVSFLPKPFAPGDLLVFVDGQLQRSTAPRS